MIPVAMQPAVANDSRPARPVYYQTLGSAEAAQHRLAREESPTRCVTRVEHVTGILRAVEGGTGYELGFGPGGVDYEVREVSALEIEQRVQAALRRAVAELYEKAAIEETAAANARKGSCFVAIHRKWAAEARSKARELELQLRVSSVRRVQPEPYFSAERDSRVSR